MALIILLTVPHLVHLGAGVVGHHAQPEPDDVPVPVEIHAVAGGAGWRGRSVLPPHTVVGVAPLVAVRVEEGSDVPVNRLDGLQVTVGPVLSTEDLDYLSQQVGGGGYGDPFPGMAVTT